jgi:internalin A
VLGELAQKCLTLSTTPIDGQKATEAIKVAYAAIGLEEPEVIVCSSPRDAYLQIFNLLKRDHSQNCSDEYNNRLRKNLEWKWMSPVGEFASPAVWMYELESMTIESEAYSTLSSLMRELVQSYVRSERTIGNVFPAHLFYLSSLETPTTLFKEIYLTQLYISSLGVNLSQKAQEILRCQKLLFEHCGWIFPFEKICVCAIAPATCALTVKTACTRKENLRLSLRMDGIFTIITASDCLKNTVNSTQINGNPNGF